VVNERERVLVVGAGPAGLGAAAELQRRGVPVTVLERADVLAAPWRSFYDRLRLNTSRPFSQLPGLRFPRGAGMFPTRDSMVRYLEAYAAHHGLDVRLGTPVLRIDPVGPEGDGCRPHHRWTVRTPCGDLVASDVVVATGLLQVPFIPDWPGRSRFLGDLMHAAAYRNPAGFQGRDVLVVGAGCSGMEIAAELADGGARRVRSPSGRRPTSCCARSAVYPVTRPRCCSSGSRPGCQTPRWRCCGVSSSATSLVTGSPRLPRARSSDWPAPVTAPPSSTGTS
jgi:cation diffusion facilitator CzcD-associated flavoprotein CzcO